MGKLKSTAPLTCIINCYFRGSGKTWKLYLQCSSLLQEALFRILSLTKLGSDGPYLDELDLCISAEGGTVMMQRGCELSVVSAHLQRSAAFVCSIIFYK